MAKRNISKNKRSGFTLAEVLIVIAIIVILAAIGSVEVIRYQRRLKLMEADSIAKEIYLTAQNRLTASWASGEWNELLNNKSPEYFGEENSRIAISASGDHAFLYVSNRNDSGTISGNVLDDVILPFGSIDETVRSGGTYLIDYDKLTATVYDVFYVENDLLINLDNADHVKSILDNRDDRISYGLTNRSGNKYYLVGYYGAWEAPNAKGTVFLPPEFYKKNSTGINDLVYNEENLWVEIVDPNLANGISDSVLTVKIEGKISGASLTLTIPVEENYSTNFNILKSSKTESSYLCKHIDKNGKRYYYLLLDSLTTDTGNSNFAGQFGNHFNKYLDDGNKFIIGENIILTAYLSNENLGVSNVSSVQSPLVNSLFGGLIDSGTGKYKAVISNPRHLQNLSNEASSISYDEQTGEGGKFTLIGASLANNIYWETFGSEKGYKDQIAYCPVSVNEETSTFCSEWKKNVSYRFKNDTAISEKRDLFFRPINNAYSNVGGKKYMSFTGSFLLEGNHKSIYNLNIFRDAADLGLFPQLKPGASLNISNLNIINPRIEQLGNTSHNTGAILGKNDEGYFVANNVHVFMSSASEYKAGSYNIETGTKNSSAGRRISGSGLSVGGFIGASTKTANTRITNCSASVPLYIVEAEGSTPAAGGFIGHIQGTGSIVINNCYVGGFVERVSGNYADYSIKSVNIATVTSGLSTKTGGFLGFVEGDGVQIDINNCYSTASVYCDNRNLDITDECIGGFAGSFGSSNINKYIKNCYSVGRVFSKTDNILNSGNFYGKSYQSTYNTGNRYLDYSNLVSSYESDNIIVCQTENGNALGLYYDKLSDSGSRAKAYQYELLGSSYPFKTVNHTRDGIYHIGDWPRLPESKEPYVEDGNKLALHFVVPETVDNVTIRLDGLISGHSRLFRVHRDASGNLTFTGTSYKFTHGYARVRSDGSYEYSIWLDDPSTENCQFGNIFGANSQYDGSQLMLGDPLYVGEDIDVYFAFGSDETNLQKVSSVNSVFAYTGGLSSSTSNGTAYIENARHLMNLDTEFSGTNNNTYNGNGAVVIKHAVQTADIQWEDYDDPSECSELGNKKFDTYLTEARNINHVTDVYRGSVGNNGSLLDDLPYRSNKFLSLINNTLESYDGGGYTLENFTFAPRYTGNPCGLFAEAESLKDIINIKMHNVVSETSGNVAAAILAQKNSNTDNTIKVKDIEISGNRTKIISNQTTGGIFAVLNSKCTPSFENIRIIEFDQISGNYDVGGLAGELNTQKETFLKNIVVAGANSKIQGGFNVGGYVGEAQGRITLENGMSSTFVSNTNNYGNYGVGGFVGYSHYKLTVKKGYVSGHTYLGKHIDKDSKEIYDIFGSGTTSAGSFSGKHESDRLELVDCYTTASVCSQSGSAGGLIGNYSPTKAITEFIIRKGDKNVGVYNAGPVKGGDSKTGIIFGTVNNHVASYTYKDVKDCYYLDTINKTIPQVGNRADDKPAIGAHKDDSQSESNPFNGPIEQATHPFDNSLGDYPYKPVSILPFGDLSYSHIGDWEDTPTMVTLTFHSNGDDTSVVEYEDLSGKDIQIDIIKGLKLSELPLATWGSFISLGWFDDPDQFEGNAFNIDEIVTKSKDYYAHWAEITNYDGTESETSLTTRKGLYSIEAWGGNGAYTNGKIYLENSEVISAKAGDVNQESSVYLSETVDNDKDRIMVAAGSDPKSGYYSSRTEKRNSFVSGEYDTVYGSVISIEGDDDILMSGQNIHFSGYAFRDAAIQKTDVTNNPNENPSKGYVRITRYIFGDDINNEETLNAYSDGSYGGKVFVVNSEIGSTVSSEEAINVYVDDVLTNQEIAEKAKYDVAVSTQISSVDGKEKAIEFIPYYGITSFTAAGSPSIITIPESEHYTFENDKYTFVSVGEISGCQATYREVSADFKIIVNPAELDINYNIHAKKGETTVIAKENGLLTINGLRTIESIADEVRTDESITVDFWNRYLFTRASISINGSLVEGDLESISQYAYKIKDQSEVEIDKTDTVLIDLYFDYPKIYAELAGGQNVLKLGEIKELKVVTDKDEFLGCIQYSATVNDEDNLYLFTASKLYTNVPVRYVAGKATAETATITITTTNEAPEGYRGLSVTLEIEVSEDAVINTGSEYRELEVHAAPTEYNRYWQYNITFSKDPETFDYTSVIVPSYGNITSIGGNLEGSEYTAADGKKYTLLIFPSPYFDEQPQYVQVNGDSGDFGFYGPGLGPDDSLTVSLDNVADNKIIKGDTYNYLTIADHNGNVIPSTDLGLVVSNKCDSTEYGACEIDRNHNNSGKVAIKGTAVGNTSVTVSYLGVTGTLDLEVIHDPNDQFVKVGLKDHDINKTTDDDPTFSIPLYSIYQNGEEPYHGDAVWTSSNHEAAEINGSTGEITIKGIGETTISVVAGDYSDECHLSISEYVPTPFDVVIEGENVIFNSSGTLRYILDYPVYRWPTQLPEGGDGNDTAPDVPSNRIYKIGNSYYYFFSSISGMTWDNAIQLINPNEAVELRINNTKEASSKDFLYGGDNISDTNGLYFAGDKVWMFINKYNWSWTGRPTDESYKNYWLEITGHLSPYNGTTQNNVAPQMLSSFRPQLLSQSPLYLQASSTEVEGTLTDLPEVNDSLYEYTLDINSVTYYIDQNDNVLPYILKIAGNDKTRLDPNDYEWRSSDDSVVSYSYGKLSINGIGEAELTTEIEGHTVTLNVEVIDNPEIERFYAEGEKYVVDETKYATQKWPTVKPAGLNKKTEYIEGKRIVEESGTYYYIVQDFEADWDELIGNIGRYTEDVDDNNDHYVVKLPNSMFLSSEDFDENGNPKFELIPGDVYVGEDGKVYVLINEEINPTEPTGNSEGWTKLRDYVPGLDTGPASDALSYPDSIYNPYPGTLNNNCTWAVWYLANVNVGARLPNWGDAGNWFRRASISGYSTGVKPAKNSILVMDRHVAYVADVSEDGSQIYVKEGNIQGKYREGWWTIGSSRLGMEVYGYIYLVNDEGETVEAIIITLEAGRHDTLDEFKAYLDELGLELGEGEEVYDNDIPAGKIVSYRSGEVEKGSLINYKISLGPEPVKVTEIDESYVGKNVDEFVAYLRENGLETGTVTTVEGDEDGIVASIKTGTYSETEKVDFSVTKKKTEETLTDAETAAEDTDPTADLLKNTKGMSEDKFLEYLKENDLTAAEPELVETEDQVLISTIDNARIGEDGKVHYVVYILKSVDDNIEEVVADPKQIHKEDEGTSTNDEPVDSNKDQSTSNKPAENQNESSETSESKPEESVEEVSDQTADQTIPEVQPGEVAGDVEEAHGE